MHTCQTDHYLQCPITMTLPKHNNYKLSIWKLQVYHELCNSLAMHTTYTYHARGEYIPYLVLVNCHFAGVYCSHDDSCPLIAVQKIIDT